MAKNGNSDNSHFTTRNKFDEFYRLNFLQSEKGVWLAQFDKPMPINIPIEQQEEHLMKHAYLSDCNIMFVKMYGYEDPKEMIGVRFPQLFDNAESANFENLRLFLRSNYSINQIESCEIGKNSMRKYFLNDVIGVVEEGYLIRVWGMQQEITVERYRRNVLSRLTSQQCEILKLTADGRTVKGIALKLGISPKTVESLRKGIKDTFELESIPQLVAFAIKNGLHTRQN
ncbi:MAG: helix-turn-helix transcriptional regulator [Bacteroidota bacterium]